MHSAGLELTKLTYTRLEDNLIRHRGDRSTLYQHGTHRSPRGILTCLVLLFFTDDMYESMYFICFLPAYIPAHDFVQKRMYKKLQNVSCYYAKIRPIEWLKVNFASCVVHEM